MNNISNYDYEGQLQGYREAEFQDVTFLQIESYSNHEEVYKAANMLVEEFSKSRKQIRNPKKYSRDARKLIASIWFHEGLFRFTTKDKYFSKNHRKQVWMTNRILDLFNCAKELDWVEIIKDAIPPYIAKGDKGLASIYQATIHFKTLLTHLSEKDITSNPDLPWILRKDGNKAVIEEPEEFYESTKYKRSKHLLERHLKRLLAHKASWEGGSPISAVELRLTRQFTEDFSHGGRFYCNFQNKSKKDRNKITLDGKPVGSLDISQCHPMLILRIYHNKGVEDGLFGNFYDDVYHVHGYDFLHRDLRKKVINTLINAENEDAGITSILNTRWWVDGLTDEIVTKTFKKQRRYGYKLFDNKKEVLKFIESFKLQHPLFEEVLGSGRGLELQGFDGNITFNMLKLADQLDIPIIPIHEEYLCKEEDREAITEMLRDAIRLVLDKYFHNGNIKAKWTNSFGQEELVQIAL